MYKFSFLIKNFLFHTHTHTHTHIYIYISSTFRAAYTDFTPPPLSLSLSLSLFCHPSYNLLLLTGLPSYILCRYRAIVDKFLLVVLHLRVRVKGSIGLVRLIWMVFEMGGRWPYSCCFVGCCFRSLFDIIRSILVQLPSSFFSIRIHTIVWTRPLLGKNAFYFIG